MLRYIPPSDRPLFFTLVAILLLLWVIVFWNLVPPVFGEWTKEDTLNTFTLALVASTIGLWWATTSASNRHDTTIRTAERAYVKMSHAAPGLTFQADVGSESAWANIQLEVRNYGRTPATVTDVRFGLIVTPDAASVPGEPEYFGPPPDAAPTGIFLAADDHFNRAQQFFLSRDDLLLIRHGEKRLMILAYIDYEDEFGQGHRAGYARWYDPGADLMDVNRMGQIFVHNNLVFVTLRGFNYDRPL